MLALASLPAHLGMGWVEWGGTTVALHRPHGSQGCTPHLRARAVSKRLARAQLADSLCAFAFAQSARVGGLKIKPAKVLLTSPECARHSWLSCFGWGRCGASLRAEICAPAIDFAHSWPRKKAQALGRQIAGFARAWGVLACVSIIYQPI